MKTVFGSHDECAHAWAAQRQEEGRSGPLYFVGRTIYSYGQHYPIASFTDCHVGNATSPRVVLWNNAVSTATTQGKHKPAVRRALQGLHVRLFDVAIVPAQSAEEHRINLDHMAQRFNTECVHAVRSRKHTDMHLANARHIAEDSAAYSLAFWGVPADPLVIGSIADLRQRAERQAREQRDARAAADAERDRINAEKMSDAIKMLVEWRAHATISSGFYHGYLGLLPTALRVSTDGSRVETSRGASVTLRGARIAWARLRSMTSAFTFNGEKLDVEGFAAREITADGALVIGCHTIPRAEMVALATSQGWPL